MAPFISLQTLTLYKKQAAVMQISSFFRYAFQKATIPVKIRLLFACLFFLSFFQPASLFGADNPFPRYPVIDKNVRFWEGIYSDYSTSQAVIHDSNDLGIVYEVIPIFSHRLPGSSKINRPILKGIKNKYSRILSQLAKGAKPQTTEEKRVATLFGKSSRKRLKKASGSVRAQIGQKDRFLEGVIRSGTYMAEIRKILKREGLPQDIAYLPHVESSFNIKAYSKFGASGIWQFTRSTGKQFLSINYVVDERQDPILASHAAAKFLKNNYKLLGSWPLALTAYNYGPAGMLRAQKAHLSYEKIFSHYEKGYFKFASRNFYSEFLAAVRVAKKLEKDRSITLNSPRQTLSFTLPAHISTQDLCNHFNISVDTLKQFNPALRRSVLQGKKYIPEGYILHLPYTNQQKKLFSNIPAHMYHRKQKPSQFYRVRPGDTAGKIAQSHKVGLKALRRANSLDKNAAIFVGQKLRIPDIVSRSKTAPNIQPRQQKTTAQGRIGGTFPAAASNLPLLADTKKQKPAWKNIQNVRSVVLGELSVRNISKKQDAPQGTITVLPNESFELLADWLKVPTVSLQKLNNFSASRILHPGENIQITLNTISANDFEEKRFDFHLETEEEFFSVYKIVGVSSYMVEKGDTVWEICRKKFDLPLWLLKKYNANLNFSSLRSSQQLTIPIVKAI
jgi:peptidoglycan lytic transglycosylase D